MPRGIETEDQFREAAIEIAKVARVNALELDEKFPLFKTIANFVVGRARNSPDRMGRSWWGYEAGIASGLTGGLEDASYFLNGIDDERVSEHAALLVPLLSHPEAFRSKVNSFVALERVRLKLPAIRPPF